MELDRRKMKILGAIVSEYIRTGEPVGSKRVAQLLDTQVSPATCRNEMSLLFDLGLLEQPHTSAGRIPSHLGFRVYLDKLLTCDPLTEVEKDEIDALFNIHNPDPDRLVGRRCASVGPIYRMRDCFGDPPSTACDSAAD